MDDYAQKLQDIFDRLDRFEEGAYTDLKEFLDALEKRAKEFEEKLTRLFDAVKESSND